MKSKLDYLWPLLGLAAVAVSIYLLSDELKDIAFRDVYDAVLARGPLALSLCVASTLAAYAALAWYDRIALMHVGRVLPWRVVSLVSFTAYAIGHNIGVSVLSSGVVRYRAYSRMGLSVGEVAVVTAFCAFTFAYGTLFLAGLVLVVEPHLIQRVVDFTAGPALSIALGVGLLAAVLVYQLGAVFHFPPLRLRRFIIAYPKPKISLRQLLAAPLEVAGAAAIIHFALPEAGHPGFLIVLGIFIASFSAGLISNAPGGIGVFEFVFLKAMPDIPKAEVLAALLMFRLLYLLIPLAMSCVVVVAFERAALMQTLWALGRRITGRPHPAAAPAPPPRAGNDR